MKQELGNGSFLTDEDRAKINEILTHHLIGSRGYEAMMTSVQKDAIKDILSKHEAEIRKEIEDRYNNLKKQIEEL